MTSNGASFHYQQFLGDFKKGSFIVSGLMFRSLIHFEFIFVYGVFNCNCVQEHKLNEELAPYLLNKDYVI